MNINKFFVPVIVLAVLVVGLVVWPQVEVKARDACQPGYSMQISEEGNLQVWSDEPMVAGAQTITVTVQSLDGLDFRSYEFEIPEHDSGPEWKTFGGVRPPEGPYHWTIVGSVYCSFEGDYGLEATPEPTLTPTSTPTSTVTPTPTSPSYQLFLPIVIRR